MIQRGTVKALLLSCGTGKVRELWALMSNNEARMDNNEERMDNCEAKVSNCEARAETEDRLLE